MKIICTEKEKEILIDMFNDKGAQCPFGGAECLRGRECAKCIETNLNIEWKIED